MGRHGNSIVAEDRARYRLTRRTMLSEARSDLFHARQLVSSTWFPACWRSLL